MTIALPTLPSSPALFMHMYKAAGTTIEYVLQGFYHSKEVFPGYHNQDYLNCPLEELDRYRLFMGHMDHHAVGVLPKSTILTTLLRDPVSLCVSSFNHVRTRPDYPRYAEFESRKLSFEEFLTDQGTAFLSQNRQTRQLVGQWAYKKMLAGAEDQEAAKRRCLDLAKERLSAFDAVGITERLEESIALLCHVLGIPRPAYVPRLNAAERKLVSVSELSEEARALTREVNDLDIELHAFATTLFEKQCRVMMKEAASSRKGRGGLVPIEAASIDLSGPMNGIGWWPIAKGEGPVRRTGPGKVSTIGLPLSAERDIRLAIKARSAFPRNFQDIRITVNDAVIRPAVTPSADGLFLVRADVPRQSIRAGRNLTEVGIEVGQVAAPATLDGAVKDIRPTGLTVHSLDITSL